MDAIKIEGGASLAGVIEVSPAKNAVLPLMAAALLAEGPSTLERIPALADVATLGRLLEHLGAKIGYQRGGMCIDTSHITGREAPYELVKTMRASVLVLGPLVGRYGYARVSLPGGCAIGARPIDQHLMGLEMLGAEVTLEHGYVTVRAKRLKGARIVLDMATVTGTENLLMAACLAEGTTIIENAAREPEVGDLANCLVSMGAKIEGIGSAVLTIEGRDTLAPFSHDPVSDRIETGTFMAAAAITGSELTIKGANLGHLDAVTQKMTEAGVAIDERADGSIVVSRKGELTNMNFVTSPYPGFPTDMQAQLMALMSLSTGVSVVRERIFENRYMHVAELQRMGADIHLEGTVATITGVQRLSGANVMATDLRASAALVLAGLAAQGETVISRVYHLDRGYEKLEEKLSKVGARITRIRQ